MDIFFYLSYKFAYVRTRSIHALALDLCFAFIIVLVPCKMGQEISFFAKNLLLTSRRYDISHLFLIK